MSVAAFAAAIRDQFDACLRSDFAAGEGFTKFQLWQTPSSTPGNAGMFLGDTTTPYWCERVDSAGNLHFDRFVGGAWTGDALKFDRAAGTATFGGPVKERARAAAIGEWTAFVPTVTPSAGTYTGYTTTAAKYMLIGNTMWLTDSRERDAVGQRLAYRPHDTGRLHRRRHGLRDDKRSQRRGFPVRLRVRHRGINNDGLRTRCRRKRYDLGGGTVDRHHGRISVRGRVTTLTIAG
jgi:hypothetical protein